MPLKFRQMSYPMLVSSKNVQISTASEFDEIDVVARFCKMIPTVKSVPSFEI